MDRADARLLTALLLPVFLVQACDSREYEARAADIPLELGSGLEFGPQDTLAASLTVRAGEAVDGHRTGLPVWVAVDPNYPHDVLGVYGSESAAEEAVQRVREELAREEEPAPDYQILGPFRTDRDFGRERTFVLAKCKRADSKWCEQREADVIERTLVEYMRLSIVLTNGETIEIPFDPDSVEAFFFSVGAIDRLVIPYYARIKGLEWTKELRDSLRAQIERSIP
jgi:hypothetical protein